MPVPASISDLSTTPASNSPQGTESAKGVVDNYFRTAFSFIRQLYDQKAALSGATFTGNVYVPSLNGGPLSGLRNKHIGGHFDSNPWQRGTSFAVTASGTYVADRWRIDFDGTANISVAKVALPTPQVINGIFCRYGMKITVNSKSGNTFIRVSQRIEGVDTLTTLAATLQTAVQGSGSFSVPVQARQNFGTGGSPSADVVTPYTVALAVTGSMQQLNTGLTVPDISAKTLGTGSNDFLATEYDLSNIPVGGYIVVALSGLEYGSQATVWEGRLRQELSLCLRYTQYIFGSFSALANNATSGEMDIPLLGPMRVSPIFTNSTNGTYVDGFGAAAVTGATLANAYASGSLRANFTSTGMTPGRAINIVGQAVLLSAEL